MNHFIYGLSVLLNLMIAVMETSYYCATGDDEHFNEFGQTDSIFDALCSYYNARNNPEPGELEVEFGYHSIVDNNIDDYIPLMFHSFEDKE